MSETDARPLPGSNAGNGVPGARLVASGFAALRTPLLPFAEARALSEGLRAASSVGDPDALPSAVSHDRALVVERLHAAIRRAEVRDALFVASPDLTNAAERWEKDPVAGGRRVEHALVRYLTRMATRCTPFGLFAGASTIPVGDRTRLDVAPRAAYRRHTRLDMDYLVGLADALARAPDVRAGTTWRPNSTLYKVAGQVRYVQSRWDGKQRTHHLVAISATRHVRAVLAAAADGATPGRLAAAVRASGVDDQAAVVYVDSVIDAQVLVPDLEPPITGAEPLRPLVDVLLRQPATKKVGDRLDQVAGDLSDIDACALACSPDRYRAVEAQLAGLPRELLPGRLLQVDLVKPVSGALGRAVVDEVARAVTVLHRLAQRPAGDDLARFRERFELRYEGRAVPLMEALDGEHGIGFGSSPAAPPLLRGLAFPAPKEDAEQAFRQRDRFLLARLGRLLQRGEHELVLTAADLDALAAPDPAPLPGALAAMVTVVAPSAEAVDRGRCRLVVNGVAGPSGARLLGRFCHADPELRTWVERHLREEESREPDAVFAEVVHLPEGRMGNILLRPVLREYEIPYLGRSGAPPDRQLPVTDLLVAVREGTLVLLSRRLGRRVIPRLTSAHNFGWRSQPVYRFLAALQSDGVAGNLGWSWGPLASAPFLPRVRFGRLVLCRARWRLDRAELRRLGTAGAGVALFAEVSRWRAERDLPRLAVLADHDSTLLVDFDNVVAVESFVRLVRNREEAVLEELLPGPDELCCAGPEGAFEHELVVPFVVGEPKAVRPDKPAAAKPARRSFPPGSEWLYAKLYCGPVTADRLLCDVVAPLRASLIGSGAADRWFFIRYADPDEHVRLRFHCDPGRLPAVREGVERACATPLETGLAWRLALDTYEREVERYGGPAGVPLAEEIFAVDSDAVLELLRGIERGERGEQQRWRLAVRGVDALLDDLGLDPAGKLRVMRRMRDAFAAEHRVDGLLSGQIGKRYRKERATLERLLEREQDADSPPPGLAILAERSERLAPIVAELRAAEHAGRLSDPVETLASSFLHMHLNRLLRTHHRRQELVIYSLLTRLYEGRTASLRRAGCATERGC